MDHRKATARLLVAGCLSAACIEFQPAELPVVGDFVLAWTDDWVAAQRCNYVIPVDQTVCGWGRLTLTIDARAISVLGFDAHLGGPVGPLLHRDSVIYMTSIREIGACMVAIDDTLVQPNGIGTLTGDTLRFVGRSLIGDTLHWDYAVAQLHGGSDCV